MVSVLEMLFGVVVVAGLVLCGLGFYSYWRWDQLGTTALAVFAVVLGFGSAFSGVVGLVDGPGLGAIGTPVWGQFAILFWALSSVPWLVFALQYTGRYTRVRARTVGVLYAPFVPLVLIVLRVAGGIGSSGVINALTSVVFIYCFALTFLGAYLVIQASYSYFHLSAGQGVALATAPIIFVISSNTVGALLDAPGLLVVGQYTVSLSVAVVAFGVAVVRAPVLDVTPAVEQIGERTITRETDDLVVVADGNGTVVECNATARETLDEDTLLGRPLAGLLGADADELAERETVPLETTAGKRRYDPQVSPITDDRGTELGVVLSLRDVTDRELREQRLAVLNRVLRHNLRNKVDVIKSHAEALEDGAGNHAGAIDRAADEITELGYSARTIDQFVSESTESQRIDLVDVVEAARADCEGRAPGVSVAVELPETAPVETNRRAVRAAVDSAVENAVDYADSAVEIRLDAVAGGYEVAIADDGPGIPDRELESIDSGTETPLQHGTGLGLWQLKWAVTTVGGELAFDTAEGTTVRITVPDRRENAAPAVEEN
jgi:signal transduction histidine kinase